MITNLRYLVAMLKRLEARVAQLEKAAAPSPKDQLKKDEKKGDK